MRKKIGIQVKVLGALLPAVIFMIGLMLFLFYMSTASLMTQKGEEILTINTESVVNQVQTWMSETITALDTERDAIQYFALPAEEELEYIKHTANQYESFPAGIYIGTTAGKLIHSSFVPGPEYDVLQKPWYKEGIASEEFIFGSVYFDEDSQSYVVGASGVLKNPDGSVRGVTAADIYLDSISKIVQPVQLEQTGQVFLVDTKTNTIIGHKDLSFVGKVIGEQENALYQYFSGLIQSGETGLMSYNDSKTGEVYLNLMKVPDSDWVAVSYVPKSEILKDLNLLARRTIIIAVVSVVALFLIILILVRIVIVKPVKQLDHVAERIAQGNLNENISYHSRDEFGTLSDNFNKTVVRLKEYINYIDEISKVLGEIAGGKLDFSLQYAYVGEFAKVKAAFLQISDALNGTIRQINESAAQVTSGSDQVSAAAQALSQGASQQASAVEELAATVTEISGQIVQTADNAKQASARADRVEAEAAQSNQRMMKMVEAMDEIAVNSSEIGKIIKTIEDIAFQTNILALNAAVEAARAGNAGKGFAVVADEVRNLASKSANASKDTAQLIEGSLSSVAKGNEIANDTAKSLQQLMSGVKEVTGAIDQISEASSEQAQSIAQVTLGIDQISGVVQTNAATSEESAAASQELFRQAETLKGLVGRFKLKDEQTPETLRLM